jgi:uncharacterized protein YxjI
VEYPADARALAHTFQGLDRLTVRQRKNWWEILLSFEARNSYRVFDEHGEPVLEVREVGRGITEFLTRWLLGTLRPFRVEIRSAATGQVLLQLRRPFRWFLSDLQVADGQGQPIGVVRQRWSWLNRRFDIEAMDGERLEIWGPFLSPWTFELRSYGMPVGQIRKRWRGVGAEFFTDADNFGIELDQLASPTLKMLAFSATVLIDVLHFERSNG